MHSLYSTRALVPYVRSKRDAATRASPLGSLVFCVRASCTVTCFVLVSRLQESQDGWTDRRMSGSAKPKLMNKRDKKENIRIPAPSRHPPSSQNTEWCDLDKGSIPRLHLHHLSFSSSSNSSCSSSSLKFASCCELNICSLNRGGLPARDQHARVAFVVFLASFSSWMLPSTIIIISSFFFFILARLRPFPRPPMLDIGAISLET